MFACFVIPLTFNWVCLCCLLNRYCSNIDSSCYLKCWVGYQHMNLYIELKSVCNVKKHSSKSKIHFCDTNRFFLFPAIIQIVLVWVVWFWRCKEVGLLSMEEVFLLYQSWEKDYLWQGRQRSRQPISAKLQTHNKTIQMDKKHVS